MISFSVAVSCASHSFLHVFDWIFSLFVAFIRASSTWIRSCGTSQSDAVLNDFVLDVWHCISIVDWVVWKGKNQGRIVREE